MSELNSILSRRQAINDALDGGKEVKPHFRAGGHSVFAEFHEFTRKQIKQYEAEFIKYIYFRIFRISSAFPFSDSRRTLIQETIQR
jgi:hypothetical protein